MIRNMDKLFFNGEFTNEGNIRGEDVYQFLDNLKVKMEANEVAESCKVDFFKRHLSVSAKTIVGSVKDFDEAASKLKEVYGNPWAIIRRKLFEADEQITPAWRRQQTRLDKSNIYPGAGERIVILQNFLLLLKRLKEMSKRGGRFEASIFSIHVIDPMLNMVPCEVRGKFFRKCIGNKFDLEYKNES